MKFDLSIDHEHKDNRNNNHVPINYKLQTEVQDNKFKVHLQMKNKGPDIKQEK